MPKEHNHAQSRVDALPRRDMLSRSSPPVISCVLTLIRSVSKIGCLNHRHRLESDEYESCAFTFVRSGQSLGHDYTVDPFRPLIESRQNSEWTMYLNHQLLFCPSVTTTTELPMLPPKVNNKP
nr:hypothetical protein CFP56_31694 [Quercus suber]